MTGRPEPWVLALDLGTSSCRALVYDGAGDRVPLPECRRQFSPTTDSSGRNDFNALDLEEAAAGVIDDALAALGPGAGAIAAVAIDTFASSLLVAGDDGAPETAVHTYADTRCAEQARSLRARVDEAASHDRVGTRIHSSYHPARLRWLDEAGVPWRGRNICCVGEWLAWRWTGVRRISLSAASWTGLLGRRSLDWDGSWMGLLGLEGRQLGPLADFAESVDRLRSPWASRWPALARVRWFQPLGDGAAANVGSGVAGPGRVALTLGTTSALRAVPSQAPERLPLGAWNYRVDRTRPLVGAALTEGGNVFDWACRLGGLEPGEALDQAMASRTAGSHGLTFMPHLAGERAPGWNDQARGAITGITLATDAIDIARAAVEGVAARLGVVLRMLGEAASGEIMASGGLLKSAYWRRMVSAGIGRPLRVCRETEATSRGAALLALEALGSIDMARVETPGESTARPDPGDVEALAAQAARQERLGLPGVS